MQELEDALRQSAFPERLREALGAEWGLRRMLEDHRVPGHERRHNRVHRRQIGIVPGRDDEDDADRIAPDESVKAGFLADIEVLQRLGRDLDHIARPLLEAAHLAGRLRERPAHLPADLLGDLRLSGDEGVDRAAQHRLPLAQGDVAPLSRGLAGAGERRLDLRPGRQLALHIDAAVDRRHAFEGARHARLSRLR